MIDHITFYIQDMERSTRFYDAAFAPLEYKRMLEFEEEGYKVVGYGPDRADFWMVEIVEGEKPSERIHVALRASSREQVDQFYEAGLHYGGIDNGAPGIRTAYGEGYYAAFLLDPDGNNIEVVHNTL